MLGTPWQGMPIDFGLFTAARACSKEVGSDLTGLAVGAFVWGTSNLRLATQPAKTSVRATPKGRFRCAQVALLGSG